MAILLPEVDQPNAESVESARIFAYRIGNSLVSGSKGWSLQGSRERVVQPFLE